MTPPETAPPPDERGDRLIRLAAAILVVVNLVLCLVALTKGFHIEGTTEAIEEAEQGQRIALAAVPGLVLAVVALARRRRRAVLALVATVCAVVAVVLATAG